MSSSNLVVAGINMSTRNREIAYEELTPLRIKLFTQISASNIRHVRAIASKSEMNIRIKIITRSVGTILLITSLGIATDLFSAMQQLVK